MRDLESIFENHKKTVLVILKSHKLTSECDLEIDAALENLLTGLNEHDCEDYVECDCDEESYLPNGHNGVYTIEANNLNEQVRIEKFIEELNDNPYAP